MIYILQYKYNIIFYIPTREIKTKKKKNFFKHDKSILMEYYYKL